MLGHIVGLKWICICLTEVVSTTVLLLMFLHCVISLLIFSTEKDLKVVLGRQNLEGSDTDAKSLNVIQIINHPDHKSETKDNDIALLRLSEPVTFSDSIKPVCLAASDSTFSEGLNTWITGWGNTASQSRSYSNFIYLFIYFQIA